MRRKGNYSTFQSCLCYTTPSRRDGTQNIMQNQVIPGSTGRSIHSIAENFHFSVSLLTELTKSARICHKTTAILWWDIKQFCCPLPQTSSLGYTIAPKTRKLDAWGEGWWGQRKVVPSPGSCQQACSLGGGNLQNLSPLQQVAMLPCTETWVIFMAFELFPSRNVFRESAELGAGCHHTRCWKTIVLSSESFKKTPKTKPPFSQWLKGRLIWRSNLHISFAFHWKERVFRCKGVKQYESSLKYSV